MKREEIFEYVKKQYGTIPEYHMNKKYWITMMLDGAVSEAKILGFLDMSYDLITESKSGNYIIR